MHTDRFALKYLVNKLELGGGEFAGDYYFSRSMILNLL